MSFYNQQVSLILPARIGAGYGTATTLEYDTEKGATAVPLNFLVEMQPIERSDQAKGTGQLERWTLYTPPGRMLAFENVDAFKFMGKVFMVTNVRIWPSGDYPSGIDHYEIELEERTGSA